MRVLRYGRLSLGAAVALSVSLAFATDPVSAVMYPECSRKPTSADIEGAKGAHKAASQFYDRGDYDKAIRYWNDAYSFDCTAHSVLINISNAYEKKGDKPAAIGALETYVRRTGPDPTIEEKIKNLKQSIQPSASLPATSPTSLLPPPTASALPTTSASAIPSAPPTATGPRPYGTAPWVVVGGGAVLTAVGLILIPVGLGDIGTAESKCPERKCTTQANVNLGNRGRLTTGLGIGILPFGGVVMAGGLVWQLMFNPPREIAATPPTARKSTGPTNVTFTPVISPNQAGVSISGAF